MSLKYGLLGLLNYGSMTGYELSKAFKESLSFFWQGQTSQIYRELNAMDQAGLVKSKIKVQTTHPNKRLYTITRAGKKDFMGWLGSAVDDMEGALRVRSAFLMRLFFAGERSPDYAAAMLRDFGERCRTALSGMARIPDSVEKYRAAIDRPEPSVYWHITALFGKAYYEAMAQWAQDMLRNLEGGQE